MKRIGLALIAMILGLGGFEVRGQEPPPPQVWSVIVSIERYKKPVPGRSGLKGEGRQLARWMREAAGWKDHVLELNDDGDPRPGKPEAASSVLLPSRSNLNWAMVEWLHHRVKPGDVVMLAFAGRGMTTETGEALMPIDYEVGNKDGGWSPEDAVQRLIRDKQCSSVLSWIDAPMHDPAHPEISRVDAGDRLLSRLARWNGSSVWLTTGEVAPAGGSPFVAALQSSIGEGRQPLLASLKELDQDPKIRDLHLRRLGGFPRELTLARDLIRAPRKDGGELLMQKGHADKITAIAIRSDGRVIVTASQDSTIRVWNNAAGKPELIRVLPGYLNGVTALALSPDGRHLVGGDGMGQIVAWDLWGNDSGPIADPEKKHEGLIKSLAFLPADSPTLKKKAPVIRVVSLGQEGACKVWEIDGRNLSRHATPPGPSKILHVSVATKPGAMNAFATIGDDGLLKIFDRESKQNRPPILVPGGRPTALLLDPEGRWAAIGNDDGQVTLRSLTDGVVDSELPGSLEGPISSIRVGPDKLLAIGSENGVYLVPVDRLEKQKPIRLEAGRGSVKSIEFSTDGRWLAATDSTSELFTWKFDAGRVAGEVKLDRGVGDPSQFACVAFGPASSAPILVAGEVSGGVRRWDLATLKEAPRIAPYPGQVRRLSATADGRFLLTLTQDNLAQIWDLKEGRSVRTLDGEWVAGAFLPDGRLAMIRPLNAGGGVVVVDPKPGRPAPEINLPHLDGFSRNLGRIAVSKDGRRIAATGAVGDNFAFVWDFPNGSVRKTDVDKKPDVPRKPLTSIDLSDDGGTLLTADNRGHVQLWNLQGKDIEEVPFKLTLLDHITAARLGPGAGRRLLAAGTISGTLNSIHYWDGKLGKDGSPHLEKLGEYRAKILAVAFLAEGQYAAAAFEDGRIIVWPLTGVIRDPIDSDLANRHTESINDLMAWPVLEGPTFVSGSDDATVRFWKIEPDAVTKKPRLLLLGTISSAPERSTTPPGKPAQGRVDAPWIAFTPQGVYDASIDGENLVSFSDGQRVDRLEQYAARLFHPLLTSEILRGARPPAKRCNPPPQLLIEPIGDVDPVQGEVEIKVSLGDLKALDVEGLRLYHNDMPVRVGNDFQARSTGEFVTRVKLTTGDNRLYAMAGRLNDSDARSRDLILHHSGLNNPGQLHVLSLGVGSYPGNRLEYPVQDAKDFAGFVHSRGIGADQGKGVQIFLDDKKVTATLVQDAFDRIRRAVKGRPEDTVVVFLAGHADILAGPDGLPRYSLLLENFPFPDTVPVKVAERGPGLAGPPRDVPKGTYLPYTMIYRNLSGLDALKRLVIIDACQSEAILDDPGVRVLEQLKTVERETRQSRTNYFFAARRGEAAKEDSNLNHGLLTYVMLRGMGDPGLKPPPEAVAEFRRYPSADTDGNGVVTTQELHTYVDRILPALASHLSGAARGFQADPVKEAPPPDRKPLAEPRVEASVPSFPLVLIPPIPAVANDRKKP